MRKLFIVPFIIRVDGDVDVERINDWSREQAQFLASQELGFPGVVDIRAGLVEDLSEFLQVTPGAVLGVMSVSKLPVVGDLEDDPAEQSKAGFHEFIDEDGEQPYGSFEVFYVDEKMTHNLSQDTWRIGQEGWYWWPGFPGCLPDGDAEGPFRTSQEAYDDAQRG